MFDHISKGTSVCKHCISLCLLEKSTLKGENNEIQNKVREKISEAIKACVSSGNKHPILLEFQKLTGGQSDVGNWRIRIVSKHATGPAQPIQNIIILKVQK